MDKLRCAKCGSKMEEGLVVSRSLDYRRPDDWIAGAPEKSLWFESDVRGGERHQITSYRCQSCGYIELYAG